MSLLAGITHHIHIDNSSWCLKMYPLYQKKIRKLDNSHKHVILAALLLLVELHLFSGIIRSDDSKVEWELLCSTSDEWEELTESLRGSKQSYERSLFKVLNDELLPDILQMITAKVRV